MESRYSRTFAQAGTTITVVSAAQMILNYLGKKDAADEFLDAIKKVVENNLEHP